MDSLWDHEWLWLQWGAVLAASLAAAAWDVHSRRIPNWLTLAVFLAGLVWAVFRGRFFGLCDGLLGSFALALPFVILFLFAGGGAGDAKLMGALGVWLGIRNGVIALLAVVIAGALLGLGYSLAAGRLPVLFRNLGRIFSALAICLSGGSPLREGLLLPGGGECQKIPYGVAIFLGVSCAAGGLYLWRA